VAEQIWKNRTKCESISSVKIGTLLTSAGLRVIMLMVKLTREFTMMLMMMMMMMMVVVVVVVLTV